MSIGDSELLYVLCAPSDVLRANIPPVYALDILLSADVIRMALASREAGWASEATVQIYSIVVEAGHLQSGARESRGSQCLPR